MLILNTLVTRWKDGIKEGKTNLIAVSIYDHHLIKNNQIFSLNKLNSRELCKMQITKKQ